MTLELLIAGGYTAAVVLIGLVLSRGTKQGDSDYYLAGRKARGWVGALSASASSESAWVLLGLVGAAYVGGISVFWLIPGCALGYAFNWWFIAPRMRQASADHDATNVSQVIAAQTRSRSLGLALSAIITVFLVVYIGAQFLAVGRVLADMSGIGEVVGVLLSAAIITLYISLGGMRASLVTDVVQSLMMIATLLIVPVFAFLMIDLSAPNDIPESYFDLFGGATGFGTLGLVLGWSGIGLAYPGQPHVLQRFMTIRDDNGIEAGRWVALTWSVVVFVGAISAGIIGRFLVNPSDNELVLLTMAQEFTHPVIGGLAVAAIFAAIASTADSQLVAVSSHIKSDWLKSIGLGAVSPKLVTVCAAVVAAVIASFNNSTIFSLVLYAWEFLGVTVGIAVIAVLIFRLDALRTSIAFSFSAATLMTWRNVEALNSALYALVPAFCLGIVLCLLLSAFRRKAGN